MVPGERQLPREVLGVQQPLVEPLGAQRAQEMGGVPGEEGAPAAPPAREAVVHGVNPGVQQRVRRDLPAPRGERVVDPGQQGVGGDQRPVRGQRPVEPPDAVRQRTGRHLVAARWRPVQHGLAGPGQFGPERGDRVPLDRRPPGEAGAQQLADDRAGTVAADQVTPAPRGGVVAPGVHGDSGGVLLEDGDPAVVDDAHVRLAAERGTQLPGQRVLREVQGRRFCCRLVGRLLVRDVRGRGLVEILEVHGLRRLSVAPRWREGHPEHFAPPAQGAPAGPAGALRRGAAQPLEQCGGLRPEHGRAGEAAVVLPRIPGRRLVQHGDGHLVPGQGQGQGEADRAGPDDDHRVHGTAPRSPGRPAASPYAWCVRDVRGLAGENRSAITERMQPIAAACVK